MVSLGWDHCRYPGVKSLERLVNERGRPTGVSQIRRLFIVTVLVNLDLLGRIYAILFIGDPNIRKVSQ